MNYMRGETNMFQRTRKNEIYESTKVKIGITTIELLYACDDCHLNSSCNILGKVNCPFYQPKTNKMKVLESYKL
jgi:hypothetical protein